MAARRMTKSAIDWVAFAERVPENQKHMFQSFKARSDFYLRKALSNPESISPVDWAFYRQKLGAAGIVDQFEKQLSALKVPYPSDKDNLVSAIDAQEKEAEKVAVDFVKASSVRIETHQKELERWNNIVPFEHMTMEDFHDAFPEYALDPLNRPTAWPHDEEDSHMLGPRPSKVE